MRAHIRMRGTQWAGARACRSSGATALPKKSKGSGVLKMPTERFRRILAERDRDNLEADEIRPLGDPALEECDHRPPLTGSSGSCQRRPNCCGTEGCAASCDPCRGSADRLLSALAPEVLDHHESISLPRSEAILLSLFGSMPSATSHLNRIGSSAQDRTSLGRSLLPPKALQFRDVMLLLRPAQAQIGDQPPCRRDFKGFGDPSRIQYRYPSQT